MHQEDHLSIEPFRLYQMSFEIVIRPFRILKWMGIVSLSALAIFILVGTLSGIRSRLKAKQAAVSCSNLGTTGQIALYFSGYELEELNKVTVVVMDSIDRHVVLDSMLCEPEKPTDYQLQHRLHTVQLLRPVHTRSSFRVRLPGGHTYVIDSIRCEQQIIASFPIFEEVLWDCRIKAYRVNGVWGENFGSGIYITKPD
jgi:hypothetical protein